MPKKIIHYKEMFFFLQNLLMMMLMMTLVDLYSNGHDGGGIIVAAVINLYLGSIRCTGPHWVKGQPFANPSTSMEANCRSQLDFWSPTDSWLNLLQNLTNRDFPAQFV